MLFWGGIRPFLSYESCDTTVEQKYLKMMMKG